MGQGRGEDGDSVNSKCGQDERCGVGRGVGQGRVDCDGGQCGKCGVAMRVLSWRKETQIKTKSGVYRKSYRRMKTQRCLECDQTGPVKLGLSSGQYINNTEGGGIGGKHNGALVDLFLKASQHQSVVKPSLVNILGGAEKRQRGGRVKQIIRISS